MAVLSKIGDLPTESYYAIIEVEHVHIPGDVRSQTAPGHGYPAHTEQHSKIQYFTTLDAWHQAIQKLHDPNRITQLYQAVIIHPSNVSSKIHTETVYSL